MESSVWAPGGQEISQISFNDGAATTVSGSLLGNFSLDTEPDTFDAAIGWPIRRGFVTKSGSVDVLDYSAVAALEGMMTDRDEVDITITYVDGSVQVLNEAVLRVTPVVGQVPDNCALYVKSRASTPGEYDDLVSNFTALGVILEGAEFDFAFPYDGSDGCGRPYFGGTVRARSVFQLPGIRGATTDVYAAADAFFNVNVDAAIAMGNGEFFVMEDVYLYNNYGPESANGPRTIEVELVGTASAWSDIIRYTDGDATADTDGTDNWGTTTNGKGPGDLLSGCTVSFVATNQDEDNGTDDGAAAVHWA